jgi:Na+-translocating ferredoxin:NAD+ oxidoreductase RnfG subunit
MPRPAIFQRLAHELDEPPKIIHAQVDDNQYPLGSQWEVRREGGGPGDEARGATLEPTKYFNGLERAERERETEIKLK